MKPRGIDETFADLADRGKKALIAYLCIGDPSVDESVTLALAAVRAGADILELGVPFSDPTADGPAIARASARAIARGGGLGATLRAAAKIRESTGVPLVLFGYYNPIYVRGEPRVVAEAAAAGVDALLVVDLPIEESGPLRTLAAARSISVVPLLTPTSSPARVSAVNAARQTWPLGFIYYVSVTGVTGSAEAPLADASASAARLRESVGVPVVVGFGIDSASKAQVAAAAANGVVVGTAIVRGIENGASAEARETHVVDLIGELRAGLDSPS